MARIRHTMNIYSCWNQGNSNERNQSGVPDPTPIRAIFAPPNAFLSAFAIASTRITKSVQLKYMSTLRLRDGTHILEYDIRDRLIGDRVSEEA